MSSTRAAEKASLWRVIKHMDQRQQLPYFSPPPGQPGVQPTPPLPPPLPPRQPAATAGYEYPQSPAGGTWTGQYHSSAPVPMDNQPWATPPVSRPFPSPYGHLPQNLPPLPERPSSFRGLVSNLRSVAQNVHTEARALASSFAQQNVIKYDPEVLTQASQNHGAIYAPPDTTHQHASQREPSLPQAQYWNDGPAVYPATLHVPTPPNTFESYAVLAHAPTQPFANTAEAFGNEYSMPLAHSQYTHPGAAIVASHEQHNVNKSAAVNYKYSNTTDITKYQNSAVSFVQPQVSYTAASTVAHRHYNIVEPASLGQSAASPFTFTQTQHTYSALGESPSPLYTTNVPGIGQHENTVENTYSPPELSSKQTPGSAPLVSDPVLEHPYSKSNMTMGNPPFIPSGQFQSDSPMMIKLPSRHDPRPDDSILYHHQPSSGKASQFQSSVTSQAVQAKKPRLEMGQFNVDAAGPNSGADILPNGPRTSPQSPNPVVLQHVNSAANFESETEHPVSNIRTEMTEHIDNMVDELSKFSIEGPSATVSITPPHTRDRTWIEVEWRRPPLAISEHGEPNEVVWDCPGNVRDINYETVWFHLPTVPDFLICTRCHSRFLQNTALATSFEKTRRVNGRCRFNVSRITSVLLPQCIKMQAIDPLQEYMVKRLGIKDCKPHAAIKGRDGFKWFIIDRDTNDIMINFVSCEACYEDLVQASIYAAEFIPRAGRYPNPQPDGDAWMCDASFPYIKRSFKIFSRNNAPFSDWVAKATKRFQLPRCEGKVVEASSRKWVQPKDKVEGLVICEICYYDQIAWTAIEDDFEYIPVAKNVTGSEWMDHALGHRQEEPSAWTCDAKKPAIISALEAAVKRQDASIFSRSARNILPNPPCTADGISGGTWYTLKGGCDNYNVCPSCLAGDVEAFDSGQFFERRPTGESTSLVKCNMNRSSPRQLQFALSLFEAQQEGVWSRFCNTVRNYIDLPECPRNKHVPNRTWYGWHDCLICPECYLEICKTRGGLQFEVENELIADNRMCCLYSPRMREKWAQACEQQNATELLEFSRLRDGVYAHTVPQIEMLRAMQEMQMMSAMSAGFSGLMYQGAQSIQTVSGTTEGYLHGNSSIGWHETENGVASAEKFSEMNNGFNAANSGNSWMRIFQLTLEWEKVE